MQSDQQTSPHDIPLASSKYLATFRRQQYINLLEKIMNNLFRMFRRPDTTQDQFTKRFSLLNKKRKTFHDTYLDSEYHRAMDAYCEVIERLTQ